MRAREFLQEADISRRGFLKGLGAAAAATAVPGLGRAAPMAATVATTAPAAAAASALGALFDASLAYGLEQGWSDSLEPDDAEPNPELMEPQGDEGEMPWGEAYELRVTPKGREYVAAASPYGESAVFTFLRDGQPSNIEIAWERDGYGEVYSSQDERDANAYYDYTDDHGDLTQENEGEVIDAIIDHYVSGGNKGADQDNKPAEPGPADLARLAGIARSAAGGAEGGSGLGAALTALAKPDTVQPALPAPTAPDVLEPELDRDKEAVPAKNKKEQK